MNRPTVLLGFEVGAGERVDIPLRHMAVTGQTQESGKTTTLEAVVSRSGVKAVAFITKRGEGSFTDSHMIQPYFREQADWQFVASILEASRGEKLKFERAWIIRASKGARTLADVHNNVKKQLADPKVRGMNADVYLTLDAYLEAVVPQISKVKWATSVELQAGINAMDLTGLNVEMQHLVIRSTVDWVLNHETDTVVVIPEAWKFIPQGRNTPVKLAAESYIRQAAGLRNYLWLDSQDIAGVEKIILKSVPVWILGVQRESNEVARTLDQIPAGIKKPTKADIATLKLGQFIACYGTHTIKVYVQPDWMDESVAQKLATGEIRNVPRAPTTAPRKQPPAPQPIEEPSVTDAEARELRTTNTRLEKEINELREKLTYANDELARFYEAPEPKAITQTASFDYNEMLRRVLADLKKEPTLLRVSTEKPEMEITVKRHTVTANGETALGMTAQLIAEGYFDDAQMSTPAWNELKRRGFNGVSARVYEACEKLTGMGFLTSEGKGVGYRAVKGMKVRIVEA